MKRVIYFFYYLKELDHKKFKSFFKYARKHSKKSVLKIFFEIIHDSLKYNISILEYFQFGFYKIAIEEKQNWAGTGYMYEYHSLMNPKKSRNLLSDKAVFLKEYRRFVNHFFVELDDLKINPEFAQKLINVKSDKVVLKSKNGQCGRGIKIIPTEGLTPALLVSELIASGNDMAEEFVQQHENLNRLSPSGLNTLRIVTQINKKNEVDIIAARLRITVNNSVDNLAAGNIAAQIDLKSGKVTGNAVYSDITKMDITNHPISGKRITDFKVPFFKESIDMVCMAALVFPENRSIGWDVAITENGPELIEGNHNWCKLLWQLPVRRGLKKELESYRKGIK